MDQTKASPDGGLEAQLRGMILGNVRIGGDQAAQGDRRSQHGRGRGRGGSWRGANRVSHNHPPQREAPSVAQPSVPAGARRECRTTLQHHGARHSSHGHANSYDYQHRDASALPTSPPAPGSHRTPRPARQPHHNQPQYDQNTAHTFNASSLPRSHHPNAQPTTDHMGSGARHHPHVQGPQQHLPRFHEGPESALAQTKYLDAVAAQEIPKVEMSLSEFEEKEAFRQQLEASLKQYFSDHYTGDIATIFLVGFGSLASGFGMPGSDMDLAVVPEWKDPSRISQIEIDRQVPRLLEQAILDARMGGRLLTRTRVPILKVCQKPPQALYDALVEERKKWDSLPEDEKYPTEVVPEPPTEVKLAVDSDGTKAIEHSQDGNFEENFPAIGAVPKRNAGVKTAASVDRDPRDIQDKLSTPPAPHSAVSKDTKHSTVDKEQQTRVERPWMREKVLGPLDFPKTGCGIQCDLNFGNPLGIHNTHMLRCYSLTDPRVRPIVLFIKSWAKQRKINSAYSGTLSSYGWVLMVLHYLVNIAQPPVCPNLQLSVRQPKDVTQLESFFKDTVIAGYTVRFWRNEQEIITAAQAGHLSQNRQSVGSLLRGFFQYYASLSRYGPGSRQPQFFWTSEVLSLRTPGGIRSKQEKGWVSAKTTITAEKKVTNRYLFAIEDPFELDHNVARTVTHRGIVAIRDELRRAWNILVAIGRQQIPEGGLFDEITEALPSPATHDGTTKENTRSEDEGLVATKGQSVDGITTEKHILAEKGEA